MKNFIPLQQLIKSLSILLIIFSTTLQTYGQCGAISSIDFAASNPDQVTQPASMDASVYYAFGANATAIESLEPQDYECFDQVPFFVELSIDADATCDDYAVELDLQWLCNTTGQSGIGVTNITLFQINDTNDPGSANLDGDETISMPNPFVVTGTPLGDPPSQGNNSCTLDATFLVEGLDPGDNVVIRVDVLLDCNLSADPTGNIQAALSDARIIAGDGSDCTCGGLQGGEQTIPWKVGLPDCFCLVAPDISCPDDQTLDGCINSMSFPTLPAPNINDVVLNNPTSNCAVWIVWEGDGAPVYGDDNCIAYVERTYSATNGCDPNDPLASGGLTTTCTQRFEIEYDLTMPVISVPPPDTLDQCNADWPTSLNATWTDNCSTGGNISADDSGSVSTSTDGCTQTKIYSFTVTDECGNSATATTTLTRTYDLTAPTCPDLDDHTLTCIAAIPCMDDILLEVEASVTDNCSGDITVTPQNDTGFPECINGQFSRTFTFLVTDACDNETSCSVTYSGTCETYCTLTQGGWSNIGGNYPWNNADGIGSTTEIISGLMAIYGPVIIGNDSGSPYANCTKSLEVQSAQCVIKLLPSSGSPRPLMGSGTASPSNNCDAGIEPQNRAGRLRNNLATNAIALQLNIWYSLEMGSDLGAYELPGCVDIDPSLWTSYNYPPTVQGLLDFANDVLGNCYGPPRNKNAKALAGAATALISTINEYWHECEVSNPCSSNKAAVAYEEDKDYRLINATEDCLEERAICNLSISPTLAQQNVVVSYETKNYLQSAIRIYSMNGLLMQEQFVESFEGQNAVSINVSNLTEGMYFISVQIRGESVVRKFIKVK